MAFNQGDRVRVVSGGFLGKQGVLMEVIGIDHLKVKLDGMDGWFPFMESELELDEEKMIKVYGTAFGKIAGLKHTN